jgi:ribosomal protein L37AE/L43A
VVHGAAVRVAEQGSLPGVVPEQAPQRLDQAELDDFNARLREGMRAYVAHQKTLVLSDSRPSCPNCRGVCSPGMRRKVRGVWWCSACALGMATSIKNHCTGTRARVEGLKAEQRRAPAPSADEDDADDTAESAEERGAMMRFLRAASCRDFDARLRVQRIADGIERDRLSPAAAVARIRAIARSTGEPLATVLFRVAKGLDLGKHRERPMVQQRHEATAARGTRARLKRALGRLG